ncbi:MAG: 30S ribosomal protein S20 [Deltaproteobacteria bacterium]|nr:30S ribosomal protein S20 [Deltaproteobacteria bacterium]
MANHKSAIKRHKQSEKRKARNASIKSNLKSAIKKVTEAMGTGKAEEARTVLKGAASLLDAAVTRGVLHRNNASRKVSRLTKAVNAVKPG